MIYEVFREGDTDIAIGKEGQSLYIRTAKKGKPMKKATVFPKKAVGDLTVFKKQKRQEHLDKGFVYLGTVETSEEKPYPVFKGEIEFFWKMNAVSLSEINAILNALHGKLKTVLTVREEPEGLVIESDHVYSIGTHTDADIYLAPDSDTGGVLIALLPVMLILYLAKNDSRFSLCGSNNDLLEPDLEAIKDRLPFALSDEDYVLAEKLGIYTKPIDWSTSVVRDRTQNNWLF